MTSWLIPKDTSESVVDAVSRPESSMSSVCLLSYSQSIFGRSTAHDPKSKSGLNHSDTSVPQCDKLVVLVFLDFVLNFTVESFAVESSFTALEVCLGFGSVFPAPVL